MIGIRLVLGNLFRVLLSNRLLGQLLTDAWVDLTHLGSLSDLVSALLQVIGGLQGPPAGRRPDGQRLQRNIGAPSRDERLSFFLSMADERLAHELGIPLSLFRECRVCLVGVKLLGCASLAPE